MISYVKLLSQFKQIKKKIETIVNTVELEGCSERIIKTKNDYLVKKNI